MMKHDLLSELQREARKSFTPIAGIFELTPRCTLDCQMCYCHLTEAQMGGRKELPTEEWIEIIDTAYKRGMYAVLLTGGECLLYKGFWEIYDHCRELGLVVSINSNGTLITDAAVEHFKASPPRQIQISLYGSSEETYYKVTGHRVYGKVIENILKLKNAGLHVTIAVTPNKYLVEDIPSILKFAKDHQIEYSMNSALVQANEDTGRDIEDYGMTLEQRIRAIELYDQFEGRTKYENQERVCIPDLKDHLTEKLGLWCSAGRCAFNITWDKKMVPCFWLSSAAVDYDALGFDESWKRMNEAAKNFVPPAECTDCKYVKACHPCALVRTDPKNPGHCNRDYCRETAALFNCGLRSLEYL